MMSEWEITPFYSSKFHIKRMFLNSTFILSTYAHIHSKWNPQHTLMKNSTITTFFFFPPLILLHCTSCQHTSTFVDMFYECLCPHYKIKIILTIVNRYYHSEMLTFTWFMILCFTLNLVQVISKHFIQAHNNFSCHVLWKCLSVVQYKYHVYIVY